MFGLFATTESTAYAYIDPGTGSFILQALLAARLAVGASVKIFWHRIKETWQRVFRRQATRHEQNKLNRKDIFAHYTEDHFRTAFCFYFSILREHPVPDTDRKLFLMQRRAS